MSPDPTQYMAALAGANQIRLDRAAIRRAIKSLPMREGMVVAADYLERPPACLETQSLPKFLRMIRHLNKHHIAHILKLAGASERISVGNGEPCVGELTQRQRKIVAEELRRGKLQ